MMDSLNKQLASDVILGSQEGNGPVMWTARKRRKVSVSGGMRRGGFTLVELLAVVVILSLLITTVLFTMRSTVGEAKSKIAQTRIGVICNAIEMFAISNGHLPTAEEGLDILTQAPMGQSQGYLKQAQLLDPWDNRFLYQIPGQLSEYEVYSYGADAQPGGEGENSDVSSEDLNQPQ
ncbi:MAG: type II secretion system major pseudopilin GspG [Phycisphaerales bacterium]|nr:type II secretion system major pseudopilin GspG [Phycisphaerales bacterium]